MFTLGKDKRLKSKKDIETLFRIGEAFFDYPIKILFSTQGETLVGVTVSKRYFKKAVDRNRIKRQLREIYRLAQYELKPKGHIFIIYVGQEIQPYEIIMKSIHHLIHQINDTHSIPPTAS